MVYEIHHRTRYEYEEPVSISHHLARLTPRDMEGQKVLEHHLVISPQPSNQSSFEDYFGNKVTFFEMKGVHKVLEIKSSSRIEISEKPDLDRSSHVPWQQIVEMVSGTEYNAASQAGEFVHASPMVKIHDEFADYAKREFRDGRCILESAEAFTHLMFQDFKFDPEATDVATPVEAAFRKRRGVCQDFAHIFLSCIRSLGLPARYVSGYLETQPPPGKAKLVGADASHAWVSVWCGEELGWVEFDPTNGCIPGKRHIAMARGRDFFDVSPLKGVVYGYGGQILSVAVDVNPSAGD